MGPLMQHGVFWLELSALCLGAAFGMLIKRIRRPGGWITPGAVLASLGLLFFSLGMILVPGFIRTIDPAVTISVVTLGIGIGLFPRYILPPVLLILLTGALLIGREVATLPGFPLHKGPVEILVLRVDPDGGGSLELRHQGISRIRSLEENRLRLELLQLEIPTAVPWPKRRYLSIIGIQPGSEDQRARNFPPGLLSKLGLITTAEPSGPLLEIDALRNYRLVERGGEIIISTLSFRQETSDTGDE